MSAANKQGTCTIHKVMGLSRVLCNLHMYAFLVDTGHAVLLSPLYSIENHLFLLRRFLIYNHNNTYVQ